MNYRAKQVKAKGPKPTLLLIVLLLVFAAEACRTTPTLPSAHLPTVTPIPALTATPPPLGPTLVRLPLDDSPHPVATEWWYYNGHLIADDGASYGFHYVFFRVVNPLEEDLYYIAHLSLSDYQRNAHVIDQRLTKASLPLMAPIPLPGFRMTADTWAMAGAGGQDLLAASAGEYALTLEVTATKPAALHKGTGFIDFPLAGGSYYYSRTRMAVRGTLVDHGAAKKVIGQAWFDKQWGNFQPVRIGWDWFSLQLSDFSEVMLSIVFDQNREELLRYGTFVDKDGVLKDLAPNEIQIEATAQWRSPHTNAEYPSGWRITIPELEMQLDVASRLKDAEFDARATTGVVYWEGAVQGSGVSAKKPVTALGFVELTGYVPMALPR